MMSRANRGRPKRTSVHDFFGNMSRFSEGSARESENRSEDGGSQESSSDEERRQRTAVTRASTMWKVDMDSLVSAADWIEAYTEKQQVTKKKTNLPKLIYYDDVVSQ